MQHYEIEFPRLDKQKTDAKGWIVGCCPIHKDKNPSFTYDPVTGNWKCFSHCGGGNYKKFLEQYDPAKLDDLKNKNKKSYKKKAPPKPKLQNPPIKESYITKCQEQLNKPAARHLFEIRGITRDTLDRYQIGWDTEAQRNTIPIRDERGKIGNVRMYNGRKGRWRMMPYTQTVKGKQYTYGSPVRLYGLDELVNYDGDQIIICEGEWDRLILQQYGFQAVTSTNGCETFQPEWVRYFKDKDVVIIFDSDGPGQQAAKSRMLPMFEGTGIKSIKNILLPLAGTKKEKDITDYFHLKAKAPEDLRRLINTTAAHVYEGDSEGAKEPIIVLDSFTEIEKEEYVHKRIQCEIVISGETSESYYAVDGFRVSYCKMLDNSKCSECIKPIAIPPNSREYIGSCMSTDSQVLGMLRNYCCVRNSKPTIEITSQVTVKEFFCHQAVKRSKSGIKKQELLEKKCYFISSNHVPPGAYLATGYAKPHPKTQVITFLIEELIAQEDDYQSFTVEKELKHLQAYKQFTFNEIVKDLTNNVTNIYQRDELLVTVLLTFFSPLWFYFNGDQIRGWILSIIIGDSGLGKTQTYNRISDYIGAGDFFSCLTGSRTGLSYALVDHPNRGWQVKVGRYPANTGKLLAVDEVQHLEVTDLQSISKAMDEGFLQIDRVKSKGYDTMTRLLMLCNPKYDRVMDECMYGCEALKTIFPPTILRRVDLAVFANSGDIIDYSIMNKKNTKSPEISPEMLRAAVFWTWNLTSDRIRFEESAEDLCLTMAAKMSKEFGGGTEIPLLAPSDSRYNLARISTAFACMLMSTDDDFNILTVKTEHVECAVKFIGGVYRHPSCSLDKYSEIVKLKTHILDYDKLAKAFLRKAEASKHSAPENKNFFVKIIYQLKINPLIRRDDLKDFVGCTKDTVSSNVSFLKTANLIKTGRDGYKKQPKFVKFLREFERDNPKFFDGVDDISFDDDDPDAGMF